MVAMQRSGDSTRRWAWIRTLRPISLRGVASQLVGGPAGARPSLRGPSWEEVGHQRACQAVSAQGLGGDERW